MNDEEKIFYKFIENKTLLKQFCEEYVNIQNNEKLLKEENNQLKVKNCELENEIEKYKKILNNIDKKKSKEIENSNFEYDLKIKRMQKQIDFLDSCLSKEKENYDLKMKELISLKLENEKYKYQFSYNKEHIISGKPKDDTQSIDQINKSNANVLNKIFLDINTKIEDMKKVINDTKDSRHYVEQKVKDYETLLNEYLKKITDTNLKCDQFYKLYKESQYKNSINKSKKKVLKHQIEELKNFNQILLNKIDQSKIDIDTIDEEKSKYYSLLEQAEKKNILFYNKLNKDTTIQKGALKDNIFHISAGDIIISDMVNKEYINFYSSNHIKYDFLPIEQSLMLKPKRNNYIKFRSEYIDNYKGEKIKGTNLYVSDKFNIKKERKRKKILFYSDNDNDRKKKYKNYFLNRCAYTKPISIMVNSDKISEP
ncbi:conserved Plasmodium protein, unknown function [Plasmodium vinckei brucechwatti]|uniref:Uncharacterized protein n=1 Tax=Plasmodium vinckei brucechwatti TaxID=119398 RepID=A0A6V7SCD7_PLAVN|nr:conserved Plasmodium protein, unknown function [Plasmodium vinckei brucechwatti]